MRCIKTGYPGHVSAWPGYSFIQKGQSNDTGNIYNSDGNNLSSGMCAGMYVDIRGEKIISLP